MKTKGKWLMGIDFGAGDSMNVLAVRLGEDGQLVVHKAETMTFEQFEKIVDDLRDRIAAAEAEKKAAVAAQPIPEK